jgi:hypothetical protein
MAEAQDFAGKLYLTERNAEMRTRLLLASALTLGVLLLLSSSATADSMTASFDGGPSANIAFDPGNGRSSASVSVGSFTVNDPPLTPPPFKAFCIDMWHTFQTSFSASLNPLNSSSQLNALATGYTPNANLANELTYMGTVYNTLASKGQDAVGAVQLAIWALIDQKTGSFNGFSFSGADTTMTADFKQIIVALGGTASGTSTSGSATGIGGSTSGTNQTIAGVNVTAYNAASVYSGATIIAINSQGSGSSQNLIDWSSGITITSVTPEPSTMAIAGLGALGMIGYGWKRRKRA